MERQAPISSKYSFKNSSILSLFTLSSITLASSTAFSLKSEIYAPTFGANRIKLKEYGLQDKQKEFIEIPHSNSLDVAIYQGGYGSGKSYLAMQMALYVVREKGWQSKILGVREPIGEGAEIGFLPGDMESKTDGFFLPLVQQLNGGEFELEILPFLNLRISAVKGFKIFLAIILALLFLTLLGTVEYLIAGVLKNPVLVVIIQFIVAFFVLFYVDHLKQHLDLMD